MTRHANAYVQLERDLHALRAASAPKEEIEAAEVRVNRAREALKPVDWRWLKNVGYTKSRGNTDSTVIRVYRRSAQDQRATKGKKKKKKMSAAQRKRDEEAAKAKAGRLAYEKKMRKGMLHVQIQARVAAKQETQWKGPVDKTGDEEERRRLARIERRRRHQADEAAVQAQKTAYTKWAAAVQAQRAASPAKKAQEKAMKALSKKVKEAVARKAAEAAKWQTGEFPGAPGGPPGGPSLCAVYSGGIEELV